MYAHMIIDIVRPTSSSKRTRNRILGAVALPPEPFFKEKNIRKIAQILLWASFTQDFSIARR